MGGLGLTERSLEEFSQIVQQALKDLGCKTPRDAEPILNITHSTLRRWINKTYIEVPNLSTLQKLAPYTNYTAEELMGKLMGSEIPVVQGCVTARDAWGQCVSQLSRTEKVRLAQMILAELE